jgi:hypothetical protein
MTYASPACEFAANTHLLKLQRLQNKVLRTTGNFPSRTLVRELHKAFNIPYIYDYITKLCRQQAEVIQNLENANVRECLDCCCSVNFGMICCTEPVLTEV